MCGIADYVDMLALGNNGCRFVPNGKDDGIRIDGERLAFLVLQGNVAVADFGKGSFKVNGYLVGLEEITEVAGVCKANPLGGDEVVLHFYNHGLFTVQVEVVCNFTTSQTATDNHYVFANRLVAK